MNHTLSEGAKKRVLSKLGEPTMSVELDDEQMQNLYVISIVNWDLYSQISNLNKDKLINIKGVWLENYFQAICKEALGRVRGKYANSLPIPGAENVFLNYESLLRESDQEKEALIGLLVPVTNKIILAVYINVHNLDEHDVKSYCNKISEKINTNKGIIYHVIPVRDQETKIECVYPNFVYDEKIKEKLNLCLDDVINNINNTLNGK